MICAGQLQRKKDMRRLELALLAGLVGFTWFPAISFADSMTWTITSDYEYKVQLEFYSQNRSIAWPGGDKAYNLNDYETHEFTLNCRSGEKICYGAWATGDSSVYWGVGANDKHSCKSCCGICGEDDPVKRLLQD